jgi:hypothetical protein
MAIEFLPKSESSVKGAGPFTLPANFDTKQHAAKWVKKGPAVQAAAEREYILGTRMTADGWAVWKDGGKPHTITITSGEHILLFRPKAIQDAVNAIYGNVGKERMMSEKKGHTVAGEAKADPGLLGEDTLTKQLGGEGVADEDGDVKLNKVDFGERVEQPELQTAS